jgi:2-polyprenyl-3-methyl-5-hydroxy-6-metoxy-1,4-benzoquinol methylase
VTVHVASDWYQNFFGEGWLDLATQWFDSEHTKAQVESIVRLTEVAPGARILDLCCGHGRHSIELARLGYRVVGLDISEPSLELARANAAEAGVKVDFLQGDMRRIPYQAEFDLVVNLFTAFGYLEKEAEDQKVLKAVATALRPGGSFLLDTINHAWLMRHFQPRDWRVFDDGTVLLEDREFDLQTGQNKAAWTTVYSDGRRYSHSNSVRVYTLVEMKTMLTAAGLALRQVWGDFEGQPFGLDTARMILLADLEPANTQI